MRVEVGLEVLGHDIELIGDGEIDVAPGVAEQLRQLRLDRVAETAPWGKSMRNSAAARRAARGVVPATSCGNCSSSDQRFALHDPLGTVGQVHVAAAQLLELPGQAIGHARKDRTAQNEQLAGPNSLEQLQS